MDSQRLAEQTLQKLQEILQDRDLPSLYRQGESDDVRVVNENSSVGIVRVTARRRETLPFCRAQQSLRVLSASGRVCREGARSHALCICLQNFGMLGVPIPLERLYPTNFSYGEMLIGSGSKNKRAARDF